MTTVLRPPAPLLYVLALALLTGCGETETEYRITDVRRRPPPPPGRTASLTWKAPANWVKGPPKRMREVTYRPAGSERTEVYISIARGELAENINRWRRQMAKAPLRADEIDALKRLKVMGREGVLVEIPGRFGGGMGAEPIDDAILLGFILPRSSDSVFVKMVGPKSEVVGERAAFERFCASIGE